MKFPSRAAWRVLAAVALLAVPLVSTAAEQAFPTKPIRWLVPFAPGGVGDLTARVVAQKMTENMGQQVVIDNRPGAGMIMSATAALQAAPDGYTIIQAGNGTAISASLFKSLPYDILKDFTQVSTLAYFDLVIVTAADSKLASVADVLAFAKNNPGKLSIGTISTPILTFPLRGKERFVELRDTARITAYCKRNLADFMRHSGAKPGSSSLSDLIS